MKRILTIIFLLVLNFSLKAQILQQPNTYGIGWKRTGADTLLYIPSDTLQVPSWGVGKTHIARKGTTLYYWDGSKWSAISGSGSTYTAGYGLTLTANEFKADTATLFPAVRETIAAGLAEPKYINIIISGQSNAWGASGPTSWDTAANSRVLVWNHAQTTPAWVTARINQRPFRTQGYNSVDGGATRDDLNGSANSAFYLAKKLADENPYDTVRIVMAIGDGQAISTWFSGTNKGRYTDSITTRGDASGITHTDLFIWCQGEADGSTLEATYLAAFDSIKATLRRQSWFKPTTPIVVSGLPVSSNWAIAIAKDTTLQKIDYDDDVWTGYGNTVGTSIANDNIHYSAGSLDTLGTVRYYQTWKALPYRNIEKGKDLVSGGDTTINNYTTNNYYRDSSFFHYFTVGRARAADTTYFATNDVFDVFYNNGDSLIITKVVSVMQGTNDTLGIKIFYNDTVNVEGTSITSANIALNNNAKGKTDTTFSSGRIPPNRWITTKAATVVDGRKPTMLGVSIYGYWKTAPVDTSGFDEDATAFITAAGITDNTQKTAINNLVVALKDSSLWAKLIAIYPIVGGTATTHKYNLKDPRDADAAFRISFSGGWTHSSSGADPDGTTGYGNTFVNSSSTLTDLDKHWSLYYTESNTNQGWDGLYNGSTAAFGFQPYASATTVAHGVNTIVASNYTNTTNSGFYVGVVKGTGSGNALIYKNGTQIISTAPTALLTQSVNFYLGALNSNGTAGVFNNRNLAFATLGTTLTADDVRALNTIIEAYNDALSRGVQ